MQGLMDKLSLTGKIALVTGGGSGLGFAMADCLIQCGAIVIIVGKNEEKLIAASNTLGVNSEYLVTDICSRIAVDSLINDIQQRYGKLDILINNAGNHIKKPYKDMQLEDFEQVISTHVTAAFYLSQQAIPLMEKQNNGSIVFIASMVSYLSVPQVIGYSAAKSAVMGLIRGTAAEVSELGIRVNGIAPGWIKTPMSDKALEGDPERLNKILNRTPMNKMGEPNDIGWAAAFLCSDAAKFINGHTLVVDGGAVSGF